jgi:hypothetical protein
MRCDQYNGLASAHLDGQLALQEDMEYRKHYQSCAVCRVYLAELQRMSLMLKSALQPEAPPQLRQGVMVAIAAK